MISLGKMHVMTKNIMRQLNNMSLKALVQADYLMLSTVVTYNEIVLF